MTNILRPSQARFLSQLAPSTQASLRMGSAVVTAVRTEGGGDNTSLVTLDWQGEPTLAVPYLSSYVPRTGDVVLLLVQGPQLVICGQIVGLVETVDSEG